MLVRINNNAEKSRAWVKHSYWIPRKGRPIRWPTWCFPAQCTHPTDASNASKCTLCHYTKALFVATNKLASSDERSSVQCIRGYPWAPNSNRTSIRGLMPVEVLLVYNRGYPGIEPTNRIWWMEWFVRGSLLHRCGSHKCSFGSPESEDPTNRK